MTPESIEAEVIEAAARGWHQSNAEYTPDLAGVALPLAFFLLPESIDSLIARRRPDAVARVNAMLARLARPPTAQLPPPPARIEKPSVLTLFSPRCVRVTLLLAIAFFAQIMFFIMSRSGSPRSWSTLGVDQASAGRVLVMANIGNLAGAVAGLAAQRFALRPLVVAAMLAGVGGDRGVRPRLPRSG